MDIYTVSLFGHRNLLNPLSAEERLEREVYKLLKNHKYADVCACKLKIKFERNVILNGRDQAVQRGTFY